MGKGFGVSNCSYKITNRLLFESSGVPRNWRLERMQIAALLHWLHFFRGSIFDTFKALHCSLVCLSVGLWSIKCQNALIHAYTHISVCLGRKATFSLCRSLAPRQVQYLWVTASFYSLSLRNMLSISSTLPVNPAAQHISSAAITVSPAGCHCDELPGCHWDMAIKWVSPAKDKSLWI